MKEQSQRDRVDRKETLERPEGRERLGSQERQAPQAPQAPQERQERQERHDRRESHRQKRNDPVSESPVRKHRRMVRPNNASEISSFGVQPLPERSMEMINPRTGRRMHRRRKKPRS